MFAFAADVAMGLFLGTFLYVVLARTWTGLQHPLTAGLVLAASVAIVLLRRPNGSLEKWRRKAEK